STEETDRARGDVSPAAESRDDGAAGPLAGFRDRSTSVSVVPEQWQWIYRLGRYRGFRIRLGREPDASGQPRCARAAELLENWPAGHRYVGDPAVDGLGFHSASLCRVLRLRRQRSVAGASASESAAGRDRAAGQRDVRL